MRKRLGVGRGLGKRGRGGAFTGKVVPIGVKFGRGALGKSAVEIFFHRSRQFDRDVVSTCVMRSCEETIRAVEGLVDVADQVLKPDEVVGLQGVVFA